LNDKDRKVFEILSVVGLFIYPAGIFAVKAVAY